MAETATEISVPAAQPVAESTPQPGPSRTATVADESEEIAAETGVQVASVGSNGKEGEQQGDSVKTERKEEEEEEEKKEDPNRIPDNACETLYIQNLNEKVRLPVMTETLASLFKPYKPILPITAHRNVRMRGQAFITFSDVEHANKARKEVNEFPLYGKPMLIAFAKRRADVAVKKFEGDEALEEHKKIRLEEKKKKRRDNPLRRKAAAKLKADETGVPAAKKQRLQMPDEYLPPNSVLFVQNLPEGTTSDDLREVFEVYAGLLEIRTIPAKKDIAFVEFADEATATVAKDALHNFKIDGETKMKVTYARK
ncbi:RNA binding protein [Papiliotrema laurentii]|uniref:RNA binding protein n=1 Tax=Papiliotrema laurentii TaxID=5418 RepID=A0AAD9L6X1_PAPLA|nr:RNA binding protein [Papiliotrema laurentii]